MRTEMIENYVLRLKSTFGQIKVPVDEDELQLLFDKKDIPGMVRLIRSSMGVSHPIRVGLVNKGGPANAPAWLATDTMVSTRNFFFGLIKSTKETKKEFSLFIRKSFISSNSFEFVVCAIAHEMAHVVLNLNDHPLRTKEEAVDLTAMLFGYRDFFLTGCKKVTWSAATVGSGYELKKTHTLGYLKRDEISYAAYFMTYGKPPS